MKRQLGIELINIVAASQADPEQLGYQQPIVEAAEPGKPGIVLYNTPE